MYWTLLILAGCLGLVLLILGALPIGRFPSFTSEAALLRPPYGRILGGAILLWVILARVMIVQDNSTVLIIISVALLLVALVCMLLSLHEPVR